MSTKAIDLVINGEPYKFLVNTHALTTLEDLLDGEAFWDVQARMRAGKVKLGDGLALLAAGLEGARLAMFRRSPAWTLERAAALFDGKIDPKTGDEVPGGDDVLSWMTTNIKTLSTALTNSMVRVKTNGTEAAAAKDAEALPLDRAPSGSDISTTASTSD